MTPWIKIYRDLWINRSRTILVILSIAIGVFADIFRSPDLSGWGKAGWIILIIIPMVGILALFLYLILREIRDGRETGSGKIPMEILKERYAKGEITGEQFQKMSDDLKK